MVAGDNTVALVSPLKPATSYHFRVLAENHLGTSAPSDILHVSIKRFSISQIKIFIVSRIHLSVSFEHARRFFNLLIVSLSTGFLVSLRPYNNHDDEKQQQQQAQTDGEIPSGPPRHVIAEPLGPQQVKVTWQPPDRSLWNGELLGYTISYANLGYRYTLTTV